MGGTIEAGPVLDESEREAMDALLRCAEIIHKDWRLKSNLTELTSAIHVIQGFIVQHMLHRVEPASWSSWYGEPHG